MEDTPAHPVPQEQETNRNPDGTFKEGVSGNPGGRPKGSVSIIGRIKQIFEEDPVKFEAYVREVLEDKHLRREIIEHIDKKPTQKVEVEHTLPQNLIDALRLANPRTIEGEYTVLPAENPQ